MLVSEAINIVETRLDYKPFNSELQEAIDRLIESGIRELGLQYKVEELTAEINRLEQKLEDYAYEMKVD